MKNYLIVWAILLIQFGVSISTSDVLISTDSYLTEAHKNRLLKVVESGFKLLDIPSLHHAVVSYKLLDRPIPNANDACNYLLKHAENGVGKNPEQIYYLVHTWKSLGSCKPLPSAALIEITAPMIDDESLPIPDLYHAVSSFYGLNQKLSEAKKTKLAKILQAALKKDDNLMNLGYTFHIAALLGPAGEFALERIEDAIVQADEVDGRYLQLEGGLSVTSFVVTGIAKLSASQKKPPPVHPHQIVKLTNYLLSRKSVQVPKGVVKLLAALKILARNEFHTPICITLAENGNAISVKQSFVNVKVCDILGNPLVTIPTVVANSATRVEDDVVVISKQNFKPVPTDKTLFTMNFMQIKPQRGFYKIAVSAGQVSNTVTVKVMSEVKVDYLEIGSGDADQTTQPKLLKISHPNKVSHKIEADSHQKLVTRFVLKDVANDKPMRVHQAFIRLSASDDTESNKNLREVIFVAEPDASHVYKFDMTVGINAPTFGYQSGDYKLQLIVGDKILSNSFEWEIATIGLKFPEPSKSDVVTANKSTGYRQKPNTYVPKPEIKHMFREPEKRPPIFVSNLFTGLCLAPVLILLILWYKLEVNISKFPLSLSAIIFHLGLGSIFVLFGVFWLKLNMFETLRYLTVLGIITFLAGSKLLSSIAQSSKTTSK